MTDHIEKPMTEPLTILCTPEDIDKAPAGSIVCNQTAPYRTLVVGVDTRETLIENLPLCVLRWDIEQYPTGFAAAKLPTLENMTLGEREKCVLMQAEDGRGNLCAIRFVGSLSAGVIYKDGAIDVWDLAKVTPRPDLPKLEWPSNEPEPEYKIGKTLETLEDIQNAPVGTVAMDADGDLMHKKDERAWKITDELSVVDTNEVYRWYNRPAKIIAMVGEQE